MSTLTVGTGQQYSTITAAVAAANPGDTIQVQAGTYTNDFPGLINGLTIEGVGGTVNLVATQSPPNEKAIFDVEGNTTLANLSFSGTTVGDGNGAGVRYESGNLNVQNCVFYNNQDGLLGGPDPNGTITINQSEFYDNGVGNGSTHNIYIGTIATFTLTNSYVHDVDNGNEVKSRAANNIIENNRIYDNNNGGGYSIDLPNAGNATISGNTIEKGANNGQHTIIAYGEEGASNPGTTVSLNNNTFVNDSSAATVLNESSSINITAGGNSIYDVGTLDTAGKLNSSEFTTLSSRPTLNMSSPVNSSGGSTGSGSDTTPPVVTASETVSGYTRSTTEQLSGTATDSGSGVAKVEIFDTDNGVKTDLGAATLAANGSWTFTASGLTDGSHAFSAVGTDKAGNVSAAVSAGAPDQVDTTAPTLTITESISGTTTSTSDVISGTVSDAGSGVGSVAVYETTGSSTVELGLATISGSGWSYNATNLSPGTHSFSAVATDNVGNQTGMIAANNSVTVTGSSSDTTPPVVTASETVSGYTRSTTEQLNGTATDSGSGVAKVEIFDTDNGVKTDLGAATLAANGSWTFTASGLTDGSHAFSAVGTDKAGNVSAAVSAGAPDQVDTTPPALTATESVSGVTSSTSDVISGSVSDAGSGVGSVAVYETTGSSTVELGLATISGSGWSYTASNLSPGSHSFSAVATDKVGNQSAAVSAGAAVTVVPLTGGTAPPTPSAPAVGDVNLTGSAPLVLTGTAAAGSQVTITDTILGRTLTLGSTTAGSDGSWSFGGFSRVLLTAPDMFKAVESSGGVSTPSSGAFITATGNYNTVQGTAGADVFGFAPGEGKDTILNFTASGSNADVIDLQGTALNSFAQVQAALSGGASAVLRLDASDTITLQGVSAGSLSASNFRFG